MPEPKTHQDTLTLLMEQCDIMRDISSISVNALIAISGSNSEEDIQRVTTSALEEIRLKLAENNYGE